MNSFDLFFEALNFTQRSTGLTQLQVAEKTGLQSTFISRIKKGHSRPGIEVLEKIAAALGYDLVDFLALGRSLVEGEAPPIDPEVKGYLDKARAVLEGPEAELFKQMIDKFG